MDITVSGGNKLQRQLTQSVAEFMDRKFFGRYKTLAVNFEISRTLMRDHEVAGLCYPQGSYRPREFDIDLSTDLSTIDFIKTVIHELVHVKQYVKGELIDRQRGRASVLWNGKDHTKTSYTKQPWEREAYRLQESLYVEFMEEQ